MLQGKKLRERQVPTVPGRMAPDGSKLGQQVVLA